MREIKKINKDWQFYYGDIKSPIKTAKKAHGIGGLTAPLESEQGEKVIYSAGGEHFLRLIAQGDVNQGLQNLAGTDFDSVVDEKWSKINLPHDWKVSLPFENNPANLMAGSKPNGVSYYRRVFDLPKELLDQSRVILHFDGVMRMADVWLNGAFLGHNNSGYTSFKFDITEMVRYGDEGINALLVRVDTTTGSEGWWYEGAGIYKDVWLEILPLISIERDSTYARTKCLDQTKAEIEVMMAVKNSSNQAVEVQPVTKVAGFDHLFPAKLVEANSEALFTQIIEIEKPKLWSPEDPYLYEMVFGIHGDTICKNFGIKTIKYDENGFYLNGNPYELRGVCEHQDFAGIGIALTQDIVDYKIEVMKKMGVNAWRSAHHFASEQLLDACDRLGILLMNENRLLESTPWRVEDLEKQVKKSRMHPSLAFWSISNEEVIGNTKIGSRIAKKLVQTIKKYDNEHILISAELLNPEGIVDEEYLANFDVLGVNYPEAGVMGSGAIRIKEKYPNLPIMSTESASYFSTRGVYKDNEEVCQCNNFGSMYSMVLPGKREIGDPGVGGTAKPEEVMTYLKEKPYMGGVFLWTAFDYFGEPSPFGWPAIGSQFGIADVCGFPKDYYYYYQAHWQKTPMVHVMPHWNKEGLEIDENGNVSIRAFSNAEEVELFINDRSLGIKRVEGYRVDWSVAYQAGELKVVAYNQNEEVSQKIIRTSSSMVQTKLTVVYSGNELELYEVKAVDKNDNFVPTANNTMNVKVINGSILGLGNGNPANTAEFSLEKIELFNGRALAIVKRGTQLVFNKLN
ncbi:sugar-binding domain-containing protein [Vagococcus fluvialis]|uniref:sugar-binding domain-containing protein n=1 Tax=Vagococcus fluvialis TaxID=2738 RepID=UPI003D1245E6